MAERLVGFCHLVRVFTFFDGRATLVGRILQLVRQAASVLGEARSLVALAGECGDGRGDENAVGQRQ